MFGTAAVNQRLWRFAFNRLTDLDERLVRGRERLFFGTQFATKAATPAAIPAYAVEVYVDAIVADPKGLRASFGYYRALDETIAQNEKRKETRRAVLRHTGRRNDAVGRRRRHRGGHRRLRPLRGRGAASAVHRDAEELPGQPIASRRAVTSTGSR
ncbi:hypothetical protein [Amycolatopsis sp. CA-128772]|uniref:hypothetical protein n=1 Tax=Amycolatopsis sp. CA-128772 TaxID=2073159 RepID=UPI001E646668|nr:hypothetical protein [Amycolatopsis sp. CA-128772]